MAKHKERIVVMWSDKKGYKGYTYWKPTFLGNLVIGMTKIKINGKA